MSGSAAISLCIHVQMLVSCANSRKTQPKALYMMMIFYKLERWSSRDEIRKYLNAPEAIKFPFQIGEVGQSGLAN
ncbi:MAG: hypothetical protein OIN88_15025 [Candidatus Methanoperedens sp.]|nr:hypothetical protein [Candidatus Methanoperedens sp.]MCZ7360091.1 hypothetical protein [Candidatus Methanoperedens sp.]